MSEGERQSARFGRRWESADILRVLALALGFYILLQFLWLTRSLLMTTALGVIFGLALSGAVDLVVKRVPIRRGLAAVLIVLVLLGMLIGVGALLAPTLKEQTRDLKERLPMALDRIERWFTTNSANLTGGIIQAPPPRQQPQQNAAGTGQPASRAEPAKEEASADTSGIREQLSKQLGGVLGYLFPFVSGTVAAVGAILLVIVLAIYIASDPRLYRKGLMHLFPHRMRPRAEEVLTEIGTALRQWLVARLIAMVAVGLVVTGALMLLGIPSAAALGVLAGLLEFIPFFGPIIAAVPAIGVGLAESPEKGLYVAIAFIIIQQLEGNVITPLLLQNRVHVPPALTVVAVAALGVVFGFLGLVIGEPLLVAILVAVKLLYVEDVVGDDVTT